jgi:hypothetical protein
VALIVRSPPVLSGLELRPDLTHSLLGGLTSSGIVRHPAIPIPVRSKAFCLGERETALTAMTDEHIETASDLELCILVLKETASVLDHTFREVDRKAIKAAIREAEAQSCGQIVCVLARSSSDYSAIPIEWAAVFGLIVPWRSSTSLNCQFSEFSYCKLWPSSWLH